MEVAVPKSFFLTRRCADCNRLLFGFAYILQRRKTLIERLQPEKYFCWKCITKPAPFRLVIKQRVNDVNN